MDEKPDNVAPAANPYQSPLARSEPPPSRQHPPTDESELAPLWRRLLSLPIFVAATIVFFMAVGHLATPGGGSPSGLIISLLYLAGVFVFVWVALQLRRTK